MSLTIADLEKLQSALPSYEYELRDGKIVVMSPHDFRSGIVSARFIGQLQPWAHARGDGFVGDSNTAYRMPNGDVLAPDVSFISRSRLGDAAGPFPAAVPEVVVEIRSSWDRPAAIRARLREFLAHGSLAAVHVDPIERVVEIMRGSGGGSEATTALHDGDPFALDGVLPGLSFPVGVLWAEPMP